MKIYRSIGVKEFEHGDKSPIYIPIPDNFSEIQQTLLVQYAKTIQIDGVIINAKKYLTDVLQQPGESVHKDEIENLLNDTEKLNTFEANAKMDINVH